MVMNRRLVRIFAFAGALALSAAVARAEPTAIKIGVLKVGATGPVYVGLAHGYFATEGFKPELVYFGAGSDVAEALVAGSIDVGVTGLTAGLYNLAAENQIRVISGLHREWPSFHELGYFASPHSWAAGWHSFRNFPGHSVAITTIGSTTHYDLGLLAEHEGFKLDDIRPLPMQTIPNSASAVIGNKADFGLLPSIFLSRVAAAGGNLVGWVGDVTPWQIGAVFTSKKIADTQHDMLERFLTAMRDAARDYYDAFTTPDGQRRDGPTAPAILAIISQQLEEPAARLDDEVPYIDAQMRIDLADIDHQVAWYSAHHMIKGALTARQVVDLRYARLMHPEAK
jgi:NitT/TauT family transport system substrate-binding protein